VSPTRRFGRYVVAVSRPDKVLFPDAGLTKVDLIEHHLSVADRMLPHLEDRPLTLERYPDGIDADGFVQQHRSDDMPDYVAAIEAARADPDDPEGAIVHVGASNRAALAYLANLGTITLHRWTARVPDLRRPDRMIFDLDPPEGGAFGAVRWAARRLVALLQDLGATPFAMTTGSRGLHVVVPIRRDATHDEARTVAAAIARQLADRHPDRLTVEQRIAQRGGRLYLDVQRNAYGQTAVTPYAVRARPGAPVATPIGLHELADARLDPQRWTVANLARRLGQLDRDPWAGMGRHAVDVATLRGALEGR
jgi:bifunctional non-homologous end joining protein LigD